ncbi:MAG: flagellar filament capping protein FliD [Tolumonas sp.]|nr:flagellar filament capping protein FliD [Tolumonas sp.]
MATITSAGAGSGIDLESVISASVAAKKAQLEQPITKQKTTNQLTLSGIGQLKSAISSFSSILDTLSAADAFNKRSVNITQSTDNPVLQVTTNTGASNGQYNITVNQLATTSRVEGSFASSTTVPADGQLTFSVGTNKSFTVDVKKGDTLQSLRTKINANGNNFGLSANIVNTYDSATGAAMTKLVLDSGVSGSGNDLSITGSAGLEIFNFTPASTPTADKPSTIINNKMLQTQVAASAEIDVDGNILKSDSNTFNNTVQGLNITVLRTSDASTSNKVAITTDKSSIKDMVQKFIDGYNTLLDKTTSLGKRDTIVAGVSQNDGGALAGDSSTRMVKSFITNSILKQSTTSTNFKSIFDVGVKMDNNGKLSLDSTKFTAATDTNFDQVVALFGGINGVAGQINSQLKAYTQSAGLLAKREDALNSELRTLNQRETVITEQITKYEAGLRTQYGNLDAMLVKMNKSASYLSQITTSTSSSG